MATATESLQMNRPLEAREEHLSARTVPILTSTPAHPHAHSHTHTHTHTHTRIHTPTIQMSAPSPDDPMEITTATNSSAPPSASKSPVSEANGMGEPSPNVQNEPAQVENVIMPAPAAAAPAIHQPKIVQTAFIHKLYNMLEDKTISHLISWTPTAESFVMAPSHEFSKVLAQYFKHTNISSFVRQLNMYGFHKVSDVFHGPGSQNESQMWEFKHGNGNFRRGDLVGLREIKRRASRHALVHREPYPSQKPPPSQPSTPAEPMPTMQESIDPRVPLDHTVYDLANRLQRAEENQHFMHSKQTVILETVARLLQINRDLSRAVLALAPSPDHPIHQDVVSLQVDIHRQMEMVRSLDEPQEPLYTSSRHHFANVENAPVSPRQLPQDDSRRNLAVPQSRPPNYYRPPVPSNLSLVTRRPYGSIGASPTTTTQSSPSSMRAQAPPPPPVPHPLANVELPGSLARRHTSADIRGNGWQPSNPPLFSSGPPSGNWPSSPNRAPNSEDQRIRESFSHYSLQTASQPHSRPATPPPPLFASGGGVDNFGSWSWNKANRGENKNLAVGDGSAPPTRRGSMAHILNPTDTAERDDEDDLDPRGDDDRKRKRLQ